MESLKDLFERDRPLVARFGEVEEMEALLIDWSDDSREDLTDEPLARAEVIVYCRDVDIGLAGDLPQRDIAESVPGDE